MSTTLSQWKPVKKEKKTSTFLHPFSGASILLFDNLLFGANALSLGMATPVTALVGFLLGFISVFIFQRYVEGDTSNKSLGKAFLGGVVTGIPTSISGTVIGSLILIWSGLNFLSRKK